MFLLWHTIALAAAACKMSHSIRSQEQQTAPVYYQLVPTLLEHLDSANAPVLPLLWLCYRFGIVVSLALWPWLSFVGT